MRMMNAGAVRMGARPDAGGSARRQARSSGAGRNQARRRSSIASSTRPGSVTRRWTFPSSMRAGGTSRRADATSGRSMTRPRAGLRSRERVRAALRSGDRLGAARCRRRHGAGASASLSPGIEAGKSEGLGLASLTMFRDGLFSADPATRCASMPTGCSACRSAICAGASRSARATRLSGWKAGCPAAPGLERNWPPAISMTASASAPRSSPTSASRKSTAAAGFSPPFS